MGKEFKKKYMHPTRRKLMDMVQTGEYAKNTTIGYDKEDISHNVGDVWEDDNHKFEKKEGYTVKTGKNENIFKKRIAVRILLVRQLKKPITIYNLFKTEVFVWVVRLKEKLYLE